VDEKSLETLIRANGKIPQHIAVIMDGNGRWAKQRSLDRVDGHREGINSVRRSCTRLRRIGRELLDALHLLDGNWNRPKGEVSALMALLLKTIREEVAELQRNNVRLMTIGRLKDLPLLARMGMEQAMECCNTTPV